MPNLPRGNRRSRPASVAGQRDTTREAIQVFVVDDQHSCKAASMMDVYAPTPGADANDVLEDSPWW